VVWDWKMRVAATMIGRDGSAMSQEHRRKDLEVSSFRRALSHYIVADAEKERKLALGRGIFTPLSPSR
jgi:hypothetical protein